MGERTKTPQSRQSDSRTRRQRSHHDKVIIINKKNDWNCAYSIINKHAVMIPHTCTHQANTVLYTITDCLNLIVALRHNDNWTLK